MGIVYLGHDTRLDRPVAIKSLPEHLAQDPDRLARFEREARTLATLTHPNVAGIFGVEEHEGAKYLILEYVDGETLADRLDRGPMSVDDTLELAVQIAAGVEAAHEAGVVHRDLKPANIKITPDGQAKVLDFGLAKSSDAVSSSSTFMSEQQTITSPAIQHSPSIPGAIMGTAPYMSPEQARGRSVDKRADIWSFGVILFECLTGSSPFVGETVSDSIGAILHKDVNLDHLPKSTPPRVRRVITRCLERDKHKRYRDIGDIRLELESADELVATDTQAPSWGPARWAAVVMMLALVGVAGWYGSQATIKDEPASVVRFDLLVDSSEDRLNNAKPKLSPDGRLIAYVRDDMIHLRELASFESRTLPDTEGVRNLFWSPDSNSIGYITRNAIYKISLTGGGPIKLTTSSASLSGTSGGGWTSDNRIIYGEDDNLMQVSARAGEPSVLLADDKDVLVDYHDPTVIPGTNTVIYIEHRADNSMVLGTYDGDRRVEIAAFNDDWASSPCYSPTGHILFNKGQMRRGIWAIAFDAERMEASGEPFLIDAGGWQPSVSSDGSLAMMRGEMQLGGNLAWLSRDGDLEPIEGEFDAIFGMMLSPDEKSVAFIAGSPPEFDLWVRDFDRGVNRRITFVEGFLLPRGWSPDSKELAYVQFDLAMNSVMKTEFCFADGSGESRPAVDGVIQSFDDAWINVVWSEKPFEQELDLYATTLGAIAERTKLIALTSNSGPFSYALSPDATLFLYTAEDSGESQVYCTRYPDGSGKWQLSTRGGSDPVWSRDGTKVYYTSDEGDRAMYEIEVTREPSLQFGLPRQVFDLSSADADSFTGWSLTNDAERVIVMQPKEDDIETNNSISIIQNWYEEHRDR